MPVCYYRFNRAAYTASELSMITVGPRRWILPLLMGRLFALKFIGAVVPVGDPIADCKLISPLDDLESEQIRKRLDLFRECEPALSVLGFHLIHYFQANDPHYPYESHTLYAVDRSGSIGGVATVMSKGEVLAEWIENYSLLVDGRQLRSSNHARAGSLRPTPTAIIRSAPGATSQDLFRFHIAEMDRMRAQGSRFVEEMSFDRALEVDQDYYRAQIAHWFATGLLVVDNEIN
jgi:hypothetical protein